MNSLPISIAAFRRRHRWLVLQVAAANFFGAAVVTVYLSFLYGAPVNAQSAHDLHVSMGVVGAYLALVFLISIRVTRQLARPTGYWFDQDRLPTETEAAATLAQPRRQAAATFCYWAGAAAANGAVNYGFDSSGAQTFRVVVGITLGGLTTCFLVYLLVERALRPLFAVALRDGPPAGARGLGIRRRLLLSWALGSGVPLLAIVLTALAHWHRPKGDILLALAGLAFGWLTILVAARAVADPLERVRGGLERVGSGHLDVEVPVDDPAEVGLVEAGFNQMAEALRDRQRIEELFGRHVGADVARQALERGAELGGEQRSVTVLFVDLVGSTALAETRSPAEVVAVLNALFDAVVHVVGAEGGWVNKFQGDGALCVFGAPADQPDHAARALRAARTLRRELVALAAVHTGLDAGIGVSSGEVVAGNIGTEERSEYTVVGDPVNEAARLTDEAKLRPGRVLASERTVAAASDEAGNWTAGERLVLRGRSTPTMTFEPRVGAGVGSRRPVA